MGGRGKVDDSVIERRLRPIYGKSNFYFFILNSELNDYLTELY